MRPQLRMVQPWVRSCQEIEVAEPGSKGEDVASAKGTVVQRRVNAVGHPAMNCSEVSKHPGESVQIRSIQIEADVEIFGDERGSMSLCRKAADHDEVDASIDERAEQCSGRERSVLAHSATRFSARRNST
jgi:hypothetical protein